MILLLTLSGAQAQDWDEAEAVAVVEDLDMPANIEVAPDGSIWYAEVGGTVSRFDPGSGATEQVHEVEVATGGERGLVGMALAGDFAETGAYYLYYTEPGEDPDGGTNRLVRVVDGQEEELVSLSGALEHNGGRILVAPDGSLYVGTGENQLRDPAQDLDSLLGKILHMDPQGQPVEGNLEGLIHSYGHRNVYGLGLDPDTGELWATENSGWRRDEVNRIEAGANYGYPECEGRGLNGVDDPCPTDKGYTVPVMSFYEDRAVAPTQITFWRGELYWASLNEGSIHHMWEDDGWQDEIVFDHGVPILDLQVGPEDDLYFSTLDGIHHIVLPDDDPKVEKEPRGGVGEGTPAPGLALAGLVLMGALWLRRR